MQFRRPILATTILALTGLLLGGPSAGARQAQDADTTTTTAPAVEREAPREGWAVAPAGPAGPGARAAFTYNVKPGQVLRDSVSISNLTSEPLNIDLYARDAFNTSGDGAFALQAEDETPQAVGSWITIQIDEYTVPPGKRVDIPFELRVPDDAAPGDHAGGIIAANQEVIESKDTSGATVDVLQRMAARMYVRVDGDLVSDLRVGELSIESTTPLLPFAQGTTTITYEVENVGNVRLTSAAELSVTGLFGRKVHTFAAEDLPDLLPGGTTRVTRSFDGVPPLEKLNASLTVTAIDSSVTEKASTGAWAWAWIVPILLLLILLAVAGWLVLRARRSGDPEVGDLEPEATEDLAEVGA